MPKRVFSLLEESDREQGIVLILGDQLRRARHNHGAQRFVFGIPIVDRCFRHAHQERLQILTAENEVFLLEHVV